MNEWRIMALTTTIEEIVAITTIHNIIHIDTFTTKTSQAVCIDNK